MFKKICVLTTATVLGFSAAHAEEFNLNPVPENTELIQKVSTFLEEDQTERKALKVYDHIQHIDLRDIIKYDHEIKKKEPNTLYRLDGTSKIILDAVKADTKRFTGILINTDRGFGIQAEGSPNVTYYKRGAKGPSGYANKAKNKYIIDKNVKYKHTFTNTLFSVDYISAKEVKPKVIEAKLLLYITDSTRGDFFRRLTVQVNRNIIGSQLSEIVKIVNVKKDISLSETDFKVYGSIVEQKIIVKDRNYGITKIFPVTVGAIDARDDVVESMNFHVPKDKRNYARDKKLDPALQAEFQDFSNAGLIRRDEWSENRNNKSRITPSAFRGRPFLALVDLNFVINGDYKWGYREVGLHDQITRPLQRGFRSHGCVRIRDKDLYQLDNIVNKGPKKIVPVAFKKDLQVFGYEQNNNDKFRNLKGIEDLADEYKVLNHPFSYQLYANQVIYTNYIGKPNKTKQETTYVTCSLKEYDGRKARWNSSDMNYHTVIGDDCLTSVYKKDEYQRDANGKKTNKRKPKLKHDIYTKEVLDYWNGNGPKIQKLVFRNYEHVPVKKAKDKLLRLGYSQKAIDSMEQTERLIVVSQSKQDLVAKKTPVEEPRVNERTTLNQINQPQSSKPQINNSQSSKASRKKFWKRYGFQIVPFTSPKKYQKLLNKVKSGRSLSSKQVKRYNQYAYYYTCVKQPNSHKEWCANQERKIRGR